MPKAQLHTLSRRVSLNDCDQTVKTTRYLGIKQFSRKAEKGNCSKERKQLDKWLHNKPLLQEMQGQLSLCFLHQQYPGYDFWLKRQTLDATNNIYQEFLFQKTKQIIEKLSQMIHRNGYSSWVYIYNNNCLSILCLQFNCICIHYPNVTFGRSVLTTTWVAASIPCNLKHGFKKAMLYTCVSASTGKLNPFSS